MLSIVCSMQCVMYGLCNVWAMYCAMRIRIINVRGVFTKLNTLDLLTIPYASNIQSIDT